MHDLGRTLIAFGFLLIIAGTILLGLNRLHLPLGRLPGDFTWRGKSWVVSFPLATSITVSIILTLLLWLVSRFRR